MTGLPLEVFAGIGICSVAVSLAVVLLVAMTKVRSMLLDRRVERCVEQLVSITAQAEEEPTPSVTR